MEVQGDADPRGEAAGDAAYLITLRFQPGQERSKVRFERMCFI
jgi:hypothetical protein